MAKYRDIADDLRFQIQSGRYQNASTLPTEQVIGEEYQASRQTVRQALSILVEEGLVEKRQGSGSHINRREPHLSPSHRSVAVVSTYISDYIFPSILREIETVLAQHQCMPLLFATQNQVSNERKILQNLLTLSVDGILVEGTKSALPNPNLDLYEQIMEKGIPLIFIHGTYSQLHSAHYVLDDNFSGGKQLTQYLIEKGHRKIAGIFKSDDMQGPWRYAGYTAALREANIPVDDQLIFWYTTERKEELLSKELEPAYLLQQQDRACSAVVCYNDEVASSLILKLRKAGIDVPGEIAVVSFDNSQYSQLSPVPITSLSHGEKNVGHIAAEKLLALMGGELCQSELVPWELIERSSS